jgi:hypothetical protein
MKIKTFKFCRDPSDVINFLGDLHFLIELIQLGRTDKTEVLAWYEMNANEFLYPTKEIKSIYHSGQRDLLMNRNNEFPVIIFSFLFEIILRINLKVLHN